MAVWKIEEDSKTSLNAAIGVLTSGKGQSKPTTSPSQFSRFPRDQKKMEDQRSHAHGHATGFRRQILHGHEPLVERSSRPAPKYNIREDKKDAQDTSSSLR
ncbi:hypothetical protein H104_02434 [Trichophyton rubrum CBS 289.86]|nr:hypothetical protein H104_02434 [Trichophyton rubrum CBS 289.86]